MRIPSQYLSGPSRTDDAMTPMIDVVFQLLIFFVIASTGQVAESFLPTELPATGAVETPVETLEREPWADEVWVKLYRDADRTIADMNGTVYEDLARLDEVLRTLAEISRDNPVILDIGGDVPLGDLVRVYDTCRAAGFESIAFAANAPRS
jgi:biopolymer transport protein ExbD